MKCGENIKVSIIMPVYNAEKYLKDALDICLEQTIDEKEIICIDDGSTDASITILEEYAKEFDNIVIIKQENQGAGPARNKGIECARGKYVCFLDSDDYYPDKNTLEKLYAAAERENVLICGGNVALDIVGEIREESNYNFTSEKKWDYKDYQGCYYYCRYLYNTQMLKEKDIRFPAYRRYQDPPFLVNAMLCAGSFYIIKDVVWIYRVAYKEVNYNLETVVDLLKGIRDLFEYARLNQLQKLYENELKTVLEKYKNFIWGFAYQRQECVWEIIRELNQINKFWVGENGNPLLTEEEVDEYMQNCRYELNEIQCGNKKRPVIIYGAGQIGQRAKSSLEQIFPNIMGYAVTELTDRKSIDQYTVKPIQEYLSWKKDARVIIATSLNYSKEIENYLYKLGFEHVFSMDLEKIKIAQKFLDSSKID